MKVRIGSYDVEISAENWVTEEVNTLGFLNELSLVYRYAAEHLSRKGYQVFNEEYENTSNDLYLICREHGLYDGTE